MSIIAQTAVIVRWKTSAPARAAAALGCTLPAVNAASRQGNRTILGLSFNGWLFVDPHCGPEELVAWLRAAVGDRDAAVVDLSHTRCVLRMRGAAAWDVLGKICPLDLHPGVFGNGRCVQSRFARHDVLLHAVDERPTFDLYVPRSYALLLWDCLSDAAREFGYRVEA